MKIFIIIIKFNYIKKFIYFANLNELIQLHLNFLSKRF